MKTFTPFLLNKKALIAVRYLFSKRLLKNFDTPSQLSDHLDTEPFGTMPIGN